MVEPMSEYTPFRLGNSLALPDFESHAFRMSKRIRDLTIQSNKRKRIYEIATFSFKRQNPKFIPIFVRASFLTPYGIIDHFAKELADSVLDIGIVPIISPISNETWRLQIEHRTAFFQKLNSKGLSIIKPEEL